MKRLSSTTTFFHKRIFPVLWFGILAIIFCAILLAKIAGSSGAPPAPFLLMPLVMAVFGFVLMKMLIFGLVDEVYDAGDCLIIRNGGIEERVSFSNIRNVSASMMTNPARITLSLVEPCRFGKEISFTPPTRLLGVLRGTDPIVEDLITRVDRARRG